MATCKTGNFDENKRLGVMGRMCSGIAPSGKLWVLRNERWTASEQRRLRQERKNGKGKNRNVSVLAFWPGMTSRHREELSGVCGPSQKHLGHIVRLEAYCLTSHPDKVLALTVPSCRRLGIRLTSLRELACKSNELVYVKLSS